jgi:hypothetical protein
LDIAYTKKPLWASYLDFIEQAGADGAFMKENPGKCTGGARIMSALQVSCTAIHKGCAMSGLALNIADASMQ